MKRFVVGMVLALALGYPGLANAGLVNYGNGLIYDTDLNVTWFDATYLAADWASAQAWAAALTAGGVTGWRLPSTVDGVLTTPWGYNGTTPSGYNITSSELGHLFYTDLGNRGLYDADGVEVSGFYDASNEVVVQNRGPFANLQLGDIWNPALYWSSTVFAANSAGAWAFSMTYGYQEPNAKLNSDLYAMAVHDGNVAVPDPASTLLLLGMSLTGLVAARRRWR